MFTRIFLFLLLLTFYTCTRSDRIQYEAVQSIDTTEGYQQYLRNNPDSRFLNEVKDKLYRTAYVKTVETNTAKAYDDYIRKYPESPYLEDLIQKKEDVLVAEVFKEVQAKNTLQGYINFVTKYPKHDLTKEATKSILRKHNQLNITPSGGKNESTELSGLLLEDIAKLTPEQIAALIKSIQQKQPKTASSRTPNERPPSTQIGELSAQAPLSFPLPPGFVEEPTAVSPDEQATPFLKEADLQEGAPQALAEAQISGTQSQVQTGAQILDADSQTPPEQRSDLVDNTPIDFRTSNTPNKILYGKAFVSSAPRVIHKEFSFFIRGQFSTRLGVLEAVLGCFCCILFINAAICSGVSFAISSKSKPDNSVDSFLPPEGVIFS